MTQNILKWILNTTLKKMTFFIFLTPPLRWQMSSFFFFFNEVFPNWLFKLFCNVPRCFFATVSLMLNMLKGSTCLSRTCAWHPADYYMWNSATFAVSIWKHDWPSRTEILRITLREMILMTVLAQWSWKQTYRRWSYRFPWGQWSCRLPRERRSWWLTWEWKCWQLHQGRQSWQLQPCSIKLAPLFKIWLTDKSWVSFENFRKFSI